MRDKPSTLACLGTVCLRWSTSSATLLIFAHSRPTSVCMYQDALLLTRFQSRCHANIGVDCCANPQSVNRCCHGHMRFCHTHTRCMHQWLPYKTQRSRHLTKCGDALTLSQIACLCTNICHVKSSHVLLWICTYMSSYAHAGYCIKVASVDIKQRLPRNLIQPAIDSACATIWGSTRKEAVRVMLASSVMQTSTAIQSLTDS